MRLSYISVHGLILCLKCEDVLRALRPWFAVVGVNMRHDIGNAIFVVANGFRAAVKIACAILLPVEISLVFQSVVAVERDNELDAVAFGIVHEVVQPVEDLIVPGLGSVALKIGITVDRRALLG